MIHGCSILKKVLVYSNSLNFLIFYAFWESVFNIKFTIFKIHLSRKFQIKKVQQNGFKIKFDEKEHIWLETKIWN